MNLAILNKGPKRQWHVLLDDDEIFDLLCNNIAWHLALSMDKKASEVMASTVYAYRQALGEKSMEDIEAINNPFIRVVLSECKRLEIDLHPPKT